MACVNLWELITTVAISKHDLPNREKCQEFRDGSTKHGFCSELSLEATSTGKWIVRMFCHETSNNSVEVEVDPLGWIKVTRVKEGHTIKDTHSIEF